ncbi:MAG: hypothetical protein O3C57_05845, partial [Verrucomicrobia bacterium]|nr:hypothetical protein [Verrucomicrobiota bacterium]
GIELILLPVPTKASLYPDKLPGMDHLLTAASQRFDLDHVEFYRLLREQGVNVLDIYPAMANERAAGRGDMYCRTDTHWSGQACVKVAQLLAGVIQKKDWYGAQTKSHFQAEVRDIQIKGDLIRDEEAANSAPVETLSVRVIGTGSDVSNTPVEPDPGSPVLLLADSHGLVFHAGDDLLAKGAGLFDQLSYELGFATELVAARGSGATSTRISLYRKSAQDPDYMKSKKIVIWCFSAREFTEGTGWSAKVPVVK